MNIRKKWQNGYELITNHFLLCQGLFIGSGVIEAGCKHIVGARCKQSGMRWSRAGATHVLALRCLKSSRRLEAFWTNYWTQNSLPQITVSLAARYLKNVIHPIGQVSTKIKIVCPDVGQIGRNYNAAQGRTALKRTFSYAEQVTAQRDIG